MMETAWGCCIRELTRIIKEQNPMTNQISLKGEPQVETLFDIRIVVQ
jgi:hypothetical protein